MTLRGWIGMLLVCFSPSAAGAQSGTVPPANEPYVPRLGDIMNAAQSRHMKLWFAGKSRNWELANYELRQLKASLVEAALLYGDLPVNNVTTMVMPLEAVGEAIVAGDGKRFARTFGELTEGCNACHQSIARGFIVMRVPEVSQFGNQVFSPRGKPGAASVGEATRSSSVSKLPGLSFVHLIREDVLGQADVPSWLKLVGRVASIQTPAEDEA